MCNCGWQLGNPPKAGMYLVDFWLGVFNSGAKLCAWDGAKWVDDAPIKVNAWHYLPEPFEGVAHPVDPAKTETNTETRLRGACSNIQNIYGLIDNEFRPAIDKLTQRLKDRDKDVLTLTGQINDLATKLDAVDKNYRELSQQLHALNKQVALKL